MLMDANQFADDLSVLALDKVKTVVSAAATITATMTVRDQVVLITCVGGNAMTITLPSVKQAKGRIYSLRLIAAGGTAATIQDLGDDAALSDVTLAAAAAAAVFYSDGFKWCQIYSA